MYVKNSIHMQNLLEALGFSGKNYCIEGEKIKLNMKLNDLIQAILSSDDSVQEVFGRTDTWKELCGLYQNKVNDDLGK